MDENLKRKMCWNCEGSMPVNEDVCPYCRAEAVPREGHAQAQTALPTFEEDEKHEEGGSVATTMALLMGGCFFFLFGCLLFLFSDNGYFTLRWSDSYWFVYLLIAIPMLYVGFRRFQRTAE